MDVDEDVAGEDAKSRVGIVGGTFDPPHVAHVALVAGARHQLELDELIVVPAGQPWQKVGSREISPAPVRLEMAEAAFGTIEGCHVSDREITRTGDSYTVDTLEELSAPDRSLVLVLGADAAAGLDSWHRPDDIARLATLAVFPRRGHENASPPERFGFERLQLPGLAVSSTDIRDRVRSGHPIDGLVPREVIAIIERETLYR